MLQQWMALFNYYIQIYNANESQQREMLPITLVRHLAGGAASELSLSRRRRRIQLER